MKGINSRFVRLGPLQNFANKSVTKGKEEEAPACLPSADTMGEMHDHKTPFGALVNVRHTPSVNAGKKNPVAARNIVSTGTVKKEAT